MNRRQCARLPPVHFFRRGNMCSGSRFRARFRSLASPSRAGSLTVRELEVVTYLVQGHSNKRIALDMGLSTRTVESYRARVYLKLQVRNAVELTRHLVYWQTGIPASASLVKHDSCDDTGQAPPAGSGRGISGRDTVARARRPARRSGLCRPGASGATQAAGCGRSGGSRELRWTG